MKQIAAFFVAALALFAPGLGNGMANDVAAAFRGEWVPAKAACGTALKVMIEAQAVTFVNGSQRAEYRKLEQCGTCMGRDVTHITMLSTDAMGDSPWMIYLDATPKKKPSLTVDFGNDKKLGVRFPLGASALKKCA